MPSKTSSIKAVTKRTVFGNGLTFLSEQSALNQTLAIGVWIKTGTRFERGSEAGVSHFLEHMLFKGTENRSALDLVRDVEKLGGDFNAFTSREYTCFQVTLLSDDYSVGADILSDVLLNSTFDSAEVERERKVILQEIAMVEDGPEELAFDLLYEKIFGRHGLGLPILGTENSIRRMSRGDLLRYFRKHYRPENCVISVSGNVSHQKLRNAFKALQKKHWPGRTLKRENKKTLGFQKAPPMKTGVWWTPRETEQVHLLMAMESHKFNAPQRFAALLLNIHLGGGMSSALFQKIREEHGLAYSVYSYLSSYLDTGVFSIYVGTGSSKVSQTVALVDGVLQEIAQYGISEEDLKSVKTNIKGNLIISSDDAESRMASLAKSEIFHGHPVRVEDICRGVDSVTRREIQAIARRWFTRSKRAIVAVGPKPPKGLVRKLEKWVSNGA